MNWLPIMIVSAQVTLLAALGLLAARLLHSAAHRHSVLLAASLCILASPLFYMAIAWSGVTVKLPIVVSGPTITTGAATAPIEVAPLQQKATFPGLPEKPREFSEASSESIVPAGTPSTTGAAPLQEQHEQVNRIPRRADYVVASLWLAGTLLYLAGVLRAQWTTQLILKGARPVGEDMEASVVAEVERRLGAFGHLRVATTGRVAGPAVAGIIQPWILIPARYVETLSRDELLQVLIHEGAHALRRDPLVALLQRIGGAMFWWHPLVHLVNRDLTRAREEVCDNFVLIHTEPEIYGTTLLRLATLSPAMARLPLAIGMFDGRGQLEERIRGLLDSRRNILTHVRFVTTATVLSAFVLVSAVVAATRVGAQNPGDAPPVAPGIVAKAADTALAEGVDVKEFRLILTYHGESDKPFYNLILNVPPPGAQQASPFSLAQQISPEQAGKLIEHLQESKFFEHAKVTQTQDDLETGPQYLLRVRLGEKHYEETLGWNVGTIARLDAIRKRLNGDAAKAMDQLLARLDGQRQVWESGAASDDDYRLLHERYRALILAAAKAGKKEEVAKLTDRFNVSIGDKLLFVQVTPRVGPIAEHATLFSKFFDPQRNIGIGKHNFAVSAKPIVLQNHDGQGIVLIATNPLGGNKWPEDLQLTLVMDPVEKSVIRQAAAPPQLKTSQWGEPADGIRARLSADKHVFEAGEPIPLTLEIENVGDQTKDYRVPLLGAPHKLSVVDEQGREAHPLLGLYQITVGPERVERLASGQKLSLASFDLADSFYLRRPGRYAVRWQSEPAGATFELEVVANLPRAMADGDPIGRLLPLVRKRWWLGAGPGGAVKFKPGSNWGETTGRMVTFVYNPPSSSKDAGHVWLWLAEKPAAAQPVDLNSSAPASEYLGKIARWHVYFLASEIGVKAWPTAKEEIKQALEGAKGPTS